MLESVKIPVVEDTEAEVEKTPEELRKEAKAVKKWLKRINDEKDVHEDYRDQGHEAWQIFLDDKPGHRIYYPLFWSVVSIEHSAVYSNTPIPDIRPRNTDKNPLYKEAAQVMQQSLEFYLDNTDFDDNYDRTVEDYLIAATGVPRVKLDSEILDEENIGFQLVRIEHTPWDRFGWEPVSNWDHCNWIYFEHHMQVKEIRARWGEDIEIDETDEDRPGRKGDGRSRTKNDKDKGVVYEIWDKKNKEMLIVIRGCSKIPEVMKDPLQLTGFFPVPEPMLLNLSPDELIPTTDYSYIQEFDADIQRMAKRRRALIEQIKAASLHDSSLVEIENFMTISDGDSVPVEHLLERMEGKADLSNVMMFWPNDERIKVVQLLTEQINEMRANVDEIMGISDILRGSSNPQDAQGTNMIKERWAGIRLRKKQKAVQKQIRTLFRMMAEITVEHVTVDNLEAMTQMTVTPEMHDLLQNDLMRQFAIDVETDSTVAKDEMIDRAVRNELMKGITSFVQIVAPAVQQNQIPADLAREILQVATDPYKKYSRGMDDVIENLPTTMQQLHKVQGEKQQLQGQNQAQLKEMQQKDYALAQYSQEQTARDDLEAEGKHAANMGKASKDLAGASLDEVKAILTELQGITERMKPANVEADTAKKLADAEESLQPDVSPQPRG